MIEYERRAMIETEDKYTFRQSGQISSQTGLIGYLRADMDTDGNGFYSSWNDFSEDLKTDEFKQELDAVINSLREEGDILSNRSALANYCHSNPQSKMTVERNSYGVRINTEKHAYLLRLNPNKGEYNLYCYCYRRDWLDRHMAQARRGIRFITPHYQELFRLPDGDRIRIITPDGEKLDRTIRYVDDYHMELGSGFGDNIFHICEFAERMENAGNKVIPLRSALPEKCYVYVEAADRIGIVTRGEDGYQPAGIKPEPGVSKQKAAEHLNDAMGVTSAQAEAMKCGSLFGWELKLADPANYAFDGTFKAPKHRDWGEAR